MGKLLHENTVQVFDVSISSSPENLSFIVMEYVEGIEFERFLLTQGKSLTVSAILDLFRQIARGLDAAHERGIVHRDIKPRNILITMPQRIAKIMDFGVAKVEMENVFETTEGGTVGTPAYMAPEQIAGGRVTPAADLFAFAVTIYHALTRKLPFDAKCASSFMYAQVTSEPIPVHQRNPLLPAALHRALAPALSKDPARRPVSASALADAVSDSLEGFKSHSFAELFADGAQVKEGDPGVTVSRPMWRQVFSRHRRLLPSATLGALFLVVSAFALVSGNSESRRRQAVTQSQAIGSQSEQHELSTAMPEAAVQAAVMNSVSGTSATLANAISLEGAEATPPESRRAGERLLAMMLKTRAENLRATPTLAEKMRAAKNISKPKVTKENQKKEVASAATSEPTREDAPVNSVSHREQMKRSIEDFFDQNVEKPLYRGQFGASENALARAAGNAGADLIDRIKKLEKSHTQVSVSFSIREDSSYWSDHASLKFDLKVVGHPRDYPDPSYQKRLIESRQPIAAELRKTDGHWKLLSLEGKISDER